MDGCTRQILESILATESPQDVIETMLVYYRDQANACAVPDDIEQMSFYNKIADALFVINLDLQREQHP